jgi:hypothetical protein
MVEPTSNLPKKMQLRGHCPICGYEHAVVKGVMSKHGYTVESGWFDGVCYGDQHPPMQVSRVATEHLIVDIKRECVELRERVEKLKDGSVKPAFVTNLVFKQGRSQKEFTPFAEASKYEQDRQVQSDIWSSENRAEYGEGFVVQMAKLLDEVHGKPLREVDVNEGKPVPIKSGETRSTPSGRKLTATRVDGAKIYWKDENDIKGLSSSIAWRKFKPESSSNS